MIVFAAICPHPPVIVPEVGGESINKVRKTIAAMEKLAHDFAAAKVDTIIIISPHGPILTDRFNVRFAETFLGDLSMFGAPEVKLELRGNRRLAHAVAHAAAGNNLSTKLLSSPELDHGITVPLYFLLKNLSYPPTLIPIGFTDLSLKDHYQFGAMIARVCESKLNRIAIIASGDLSHRLILSREFDQTLVELLKKNDAQGVINLDPQLIEEAGECGLRSIVILLGAIQPPTSNLQFLSYEGPFGVGYLVAKNLSPTTQRSLPQN